MPNRNPSRSPCRLVFGVAPVAFFRFAHAGFRLRASSAGKSGQIKIRRGQLGSAYFIFGLRAAPKIRAGCSFRRFAPVQKLNRPASSSSSFRFLISRDFPGEAAKNGTTRMIYEIATQRDERATRATLRSAKG